MMPALLIRICSGCAEDRNFAVKASIDAGSSKSIGSISASSPASAAADRPTSRAGTMTRAPAAFSARTVSRPRPEYPPVTMAALPPRSMPAMTSAAVVAAPKPEPIGAWGVGMTPNSQCRVGLGGIGRQRIHVVAPMDDLAILDRHHRDEAVVIGFAGAELLPVHLVFED